MTTSLYWLKMSDMISPEYLKLQRELHARPNGYGGKGDKWAAGVAGLVESYGATSVLDYGCGEGSLIKALRTMLSSVVRLDEYDPAIKGKDDKPEFADIVVCTDVLEHVEIDCLPTVLDHLRILARKAVFVVIATRPSNKTMTDGRNAHLIVEPAEWWQAAVDKAGFVVHPGPASPLKKPSREWVAVLTAAVPA